LAACSAALTTASTAEAGCPGTVKRIPDHASGGRGVGHCEHVEDKFAELRNYFLSRGGHLFDLEDLMGEIRVKAQEGGTLTYGDLMRRHHISRGRTHGVAEVLWRISEREACLVGVTHDPPHFITAVVVRAGTKYPSGGFFGLEGTPPDLKRSERSYTDPHLTPSERKYVDSIREHLRSCHESGG